MVPARMETGVQPAQSAGEDALPRSFGRYVLFDHIGRGGMADIYLARMRTSLGGGRNVVVKQILAKLGDDPAFRAMLTAEAKLAAHLNHANVVQVFDFGEEGDRLFIAMDYVEGFDLAQMLKRLSKGKIPFPAEFAILVVREVLRALDYAHRAKDDRGASLGIVHRDVSPSNVLVSFEGEVKLCDFGIARALDREGDEDAVRRARVAGKSAYMAPEHARGDRVDPRSDLFAAGILLWELCAGRRLYRGDDEQMLALARAAEVPPLPNRNLPDAAGLQAVLDRALASSPGDRYPSCAAFLEALETWAIGAKLMASPLRFGAFLTEHFAEDIVSLRRARETAAAEIVDDADPSTFGPSSSPPPANGSRAASAPKPPKVPRDWMPPPPDELPYARTEELDALPPPPPPPKVAALSKSGAQKPKGDAAAGETTTSGSHKVPALSKSGAAKLAQLTKSDAARAAKVDAVKAKAEPPATPTSATPSSTTSPSSSSATPASSSAPSTGTPTSSAASTAPAASVASASGTPSATPSATSSATRVSGASATPSGPASLTSSSGPRSISIDVALDSGARATPSARVTAAKPPGALEAFSPAWLALVACGAVAFGFVVYFVVSALAR
jgi:serine/threonine protein kinase